MTDEHVSAAVGRAQRILRAERRADEADEIGKILVAPPRAKPAVFVAGEDKRGKSTLVNALLAQPDASPTGVEVVTAAPITFFASERPAGLVFRYGSDDPQPCTPEEARRLATVAGNPGNAGNVRAVAVGVASPLLDVINLVDTPGVGGLGSAYGELTIQSLASADALVFVIAAGAQFRAAELKFLREASANIDAVVIALTKTDLFRGWRTILDDNMRILAEQAPRFAGCPVVPVSSLLALRGLGSADAGEASELRVESGTARLEEVIKAQVVERVEVLRERNALRASIGALTGVERRLQERLAGMDGAGEGDSRAALEAERARLRVLGEDRADWLSGLDVEVRKLTLERAEAATKGCLELRRAYDARLKKLEKADRDVLPGELIADLTALAGRLNETAAERLSAFVRRTLAEVEEGNRLSSTIHDLTDYSLQEQLETISFGSTDISAQDKLSILTSFSSGRSLGAFAGVAASAFLAPPMGLLLGFGLGGMFAFQSFRSRGQTAFVAEFQAWMQTEIAQAQSAINTTFAHRMIDVQAEIRRAIQAVLARRESELTEAIEAARRALEEEASARDERRKKLHANIQAIRTLRRNSSQLLAGLRADEPHAAAERA
jgi:Dynamin family